MDYSLPPPKNWQDFESICHRLWQEIWLDPNAQKNGRLGQPQHGVDIFGVPYYLGRKKSIYHGVQCKVRAYHKNLSESEIFSDSQQAKSFVPQISNLTFATTSVRDSNDQLLARTISSNENFPFEVQIWSWNDLEEEILFRPNICRQYYNQIISLDNLPQRVKLTPLSNRDHIHAFFSRPKLKSKFSRKLIGFLVPLFYELVDNSFTHGNATSLILGFEDDVLSLKDNGISFNPIDELKFNSPDRHQGVGSFIFRTFTETFRNRISFSWSRISSYNELTFDLSEIVDDFFVMPMSSVEPDIEVSLFESSSRQLAKVKASQIKLSEKEIFIVIRRINQPSAAIGFIDEVLARLGKEQTLTISMPKHEYFNDLQTWFNDERLIIKYERFLE